MIDYVTYGARCKTNRTYATQNRYRVLKYGFLANIGLGVEPTNFSEAMKDKQWREAMRKKIHALEDNGKWSLVSLSAPNYSSDHNPILLNTSNYSHDGPKLFKFEAMWLEDKSCTHVVSSIWNLSFSGSPTFKFHSKSKNVRKALKVWNSAHFGNYHHKIKDLKEKIAKSQQSDPDNYSPTTDNGVQLELDMWLQRLENFRK